MKEFNNILILADNILRNINNYNLNAKAND